MVSQPVPPAGAPLLVVGASARAAAGSVRRAGWSPRAVDAFADLDLRRLTPTIQVRDFPRGLLLAARDFEPAPWLYTGGLENHPDLVDAIAQSRPLWGNDGATLRQVRDPLRVYEALQAAGVKCPDVCLQAATVPGDGSWLVKPRRSCGGRKIAPYTSAWQSEDRDAFYWQRFCVGMPCAAIYLAAHGQNRLCGVTRQLTGERWLGAGPFWYCGSLGPLPLSQALREQFERIGEALAAAFPLCGLFGVDCVFDGDDVWPVEVNPRYSASIETLERAGSWSSVADHARACGRGELPTAPPRFERVSGKVVLYAERPLIISADHEAAFLDALVTDEVADAPSAGTHVPAGGPICTLLTVGEDLAAVDARLRAQADQWRAILDLAPRPERLPHGER